MTLEENKDMLSTIDELQASFINHEHRISRSNISLEGAFVAQSSISHGRGKGRYKSKGKGGCNNSLMNVIGRGHNQNPS